MRTSDAEKQMVFEAIKTGANDYIKKPFQGDALCLKYLNNLYPDNLKIAYKSKNDIFIYFIFNQRVIFIISS
jgi:DNA-binding NtrC family response regulator